MTFDPKQHMTNLKGKDYLEVKWRLVWFRDEHPDGAISTEVISFEPLLVKAAVHTAEGVLLATGHAGAVAKANAVWSGRDFEKAETAAIGRALGHAGYGTQFEPDDEGDYLADSPVERKQPTSATKQVPAAAPAPQQVSTPTAPQIGEKRAFVVDMVRIAETQDGKRYYTLIGDDDTEILTFSRDLFRSWGYPDELTATWENGTFEMPEPQTIEAKYMARKDGSGTYYAAILPEKPATPKGTKRQPEAPVPASEIPF